MELIKRLNCKGSLGLFKCPYCNQEVTKKLQSGTKAKSCGCVSSKLSAQARIKHQEGKTRLYQTYINMKQRCYYKKYIHYMHYGKRGITVCEEWREDYLNFRKWALKNGYNDNLTIDRINNDGNYEPNNCRFIPSSENNLNRRTVVLNWEKVKCIRREYKTGKYTQKQLGKKYGVSGSHISEIVNNKTWVTSMTMAKQQESEIGILKNIRFQNDRGFIIGVFESEKKKGKWGNEFCALGNIANPELGLAYKLFGNWETDNQWGDQFKFQFYEVMQPNDTKGIYQYLVRVCKWVGPTVAGRIVDKYKTKTLNVLKTSPKQVARDVKGLTEKRALEIQANLKENEHIEKVLVELEKVFAPISGVRKSLPMELVKLWGSNAADKLNKNPYILTRLKGIGFPTADKVALHMGYDRKSNAREKAAVWHVLNENMHAQGSVWMNYESVIEAVKELTGLPGDTGLTQLYHSKDIVGVDVLWAVAEVADNESYIAQKIARMV